MSELVFKPDPAYALAFAQLLQRLADSLGPSALTKPIKICVAGGAALHIYTGSRYSNDIDAKVFARVVLDANALQIAYRDSEGRTRILYFDTQYNDSFALLHHDAYDDAQPIAVAGVDTKRLAVFLLSPLDLAVSKLARFSEQDRQDIITLGKAGLISAKALKARASAALPDYVGNLERIRNTIEISSRDVAAVASVSSPKR